MSDDTRTRERAHQLWEAAGRPDGQHEAHWAQAEKEMAEQNPPTLASPDGGGASPGEAAAAANAVRDDEISGQEGDSPMPLTGEMSASPTTTAPDGTGTSQGDAAGAARAVAAPASRNSPAGIANGVKQRR